VVEICTLSPLALVGIQILMLPYNFLVINSQTSICDTNLNLYYLLILMEPDSLLCILISFRYYVAIGHARSSACLLLTGRRASSSWAAVCLCLLTGRRVPRTCRSPAHPRWPSSRERQHVTHCLWTQVLLPAPLVLPPSLAVGDVVTATSCRSLHPHRTSPPPPSVGVQATTSPCHCPPLPQAVGVIISSRSPHLHWFPSHLFIRPRSARSSGSRLPPPR
jgi:hypothetical protein